MGSETYFYCAWQPEDGWEIRKETFPFDQPKYTFFFLGLGERSAQGCRIDFDDLWKIDFF